MVLNLRPKYQVSLVELGSHPPRRSLQIGETRTLKIQVRNGIELTAKIPGVFGSGRPGSHPPRRSLQIGETRTLKIQVRNGIELTTKIPGVFGRAR